MRLRLRALPVQFLAPAMLRTSFAAIGGPVYGDLKQSDVPECPARACGPVAAVNSFVYLQTKYPDIYEPSVGLPGDQPPPLHWEQLASNTLT